MMGSWEEALEAAEAVLVEDKRNIKAVFVKAEALFNLCEFEHSLVLFHRGLVSWDKIKSFFTDQIEDIHDFISHIILSTQRQDVEKCFPNFFKSQILKTWGKIHKTSLVKLVSFLLLYMASDFYPVD